jgi:hypothetical protein
LGALRDAVFFEPSHEARKGQELLLGNSNRGGKEEAAWGLSLDCDNPGCPLELCARIPLMELLCWPCCMN